MGGSWACGSGRPWSFHLFGCRYSANAESLDSKGTGEPFQVSLLGLKEQVRLRSFSASQLFVASPVLERLSLPLTQFFLSAATALRSCLVRSSTSGQLPAT